MANRRRRSWRDRDIINDALERGHEPDIAVNLDNQPTLPDSDEKDPNYEKGLFVVELSDASAAALKIAAADEMIYQQWQDFQQAKNEPDYEQAIEGRPQASFAMQEAFANVMEMMKLDFPTVLIDVDDADDFQSYARQFYEPTIEGKEDNWLRDSVFVPWKIAKDYKFGYKLTRKRNTDDPPTFDPETLPEVRDEDGIVTDQTRFRDVFVDYTKEDYPDYWPCQIIFTRKAIYWASQVYINDLLPENEIGDTTLLGQMWQAQYAAEFDPRVAEALTGESLRPTDAGLVLTIGRSFIQPWIDEGPQNGGDPGQGGAGDGDPSDPFGCCDNGGSGDPPPIDIGDPPPGTTPPPPGTGRPPAPPPGGGTRAEWDCGTEVLLELEGTNHEDLLFNFGYNNQAAWVFTLGLSNLMPVHDLQITESIFDAIAAACAAYATAHSIPSGYTIKAVTLCVSFSRMKRAALLADGFESFLTINFDNQTGNPFTGYVDPKPRLRVQRGSEGSDKILRGKIQRLGEYEWDVNGVPMEVIADAEIATDIEVNITNYQTVTGVVLYGILVPAHWAFFQYQPHSPYIQISLKKADLWFATSLFTGHFNFDDDASLRENPNVSGQMKWFSDSPDGIVSGMIADYVHDGDYPGAEIASGQGICVLIDVTNSNGNSGTPISVELLRVADGYSNHPDAAYTTCTVHARLIGGAQTATLNINTAGGGSGTNFTTAMGDVGSFGSVPYTADWVDLVFDISSLALTTASSIYWINFAAAVYLFEWTITLS